MRDNDNINDFDYEKDFNEAFNNVTDDNSIEDLAPSLDPVIERRSILPIENTANESSDNAIIDNESVMQMISGENAVDLEAMKAEQNFPMAILGGLLASFVCICIWALITVSVQYQISYMAIGVGFVVGYSIKMFGKGLTPIYGILGATLAFLTCFFGNIVSYTCFIADKYEDYSYIEAISDLDIPQSINIAIDTFHPMDLFFYGLAIYTGYMFSIKQPK